MNLNIQVRREPTGNLAAFWLESFRAWPKSMPMIFTFDEGHSECSNDYRLKDCKPVPHDEALQFRQRMQDYYNSIPDPWEPINIVLVKRLVRA
jgi:hypothetical protein